MVSIETQTCMHDGYFPKLFHRHKVGLLDMWHLASNHLLQNVLKWKSLRQLIRASCLDLAAGPVLWAFGNRLREEQLAGSPEWLRELLTSKTFASLQRSSVTHMSGMQK